MRRLRLLSLSILVLSPFFCSGQIGLNALIADSATLKPISFVTVRLNNSFRGTITNEQGYFAMDVSEKDSLSFSIVGYHSKKVSVMEIQRTSVVYLSQAVQILKTIEFTGLIDISPMLPKLDAPSPYRNTLFPVETDRPVVLGFQGLQIFGPGYVIRGGDLKPSKEERKLEQIKKENVAAKGYVALVNDPEVKDKLMKDYNLTERQYYSHLASFNQKNKDFIYDLDDSDVVLLIFKYFAENVKN
ncbi:MAG TPA: carboxypeptidase-like regulatory domain-containing protein [Chryseosolibacter sp.]